MLAVDSNSRRFDFVQRESTVGWRVVFIRKLDANRNPDLLGKMWGKAGCRVSRAESANSRLNF